MRIISNFSDYYDKGLMYGIDELIVYKRLSEIIEVKDSHTDEIRSMYKHNIRPFTIYFCGKLHFGIRFEEQNYEFNSKHGKTSFYDVNTACTFLDKLEKKYDETFRKDIYYKKVTEKEKNSMKSFIKSWINNLTTKWNFRRREDYLTENELYSTEVLTAKYNSVAIENNIPYIVIYREDEGRYHKKFYVEYNPQLSMWDFIKVKNPIEAFQEISMYVGGVLRQPDNGMVDISNKSMAEKKGFGHKYAFRKEPEDKSRIK